MSSGVLAVTFLFTTSRGRVIADAPRRWGCARDTVPLVFTHVGKTGGRSVMQNMVRGAVGVPERDIRWWARWRSYDDAGRARAAYKLPSGERAEQRPASGDSDINGLRSNRNSMRV